MLNNWLKIFIYQVRHNKFFTFLNVLGLSIGIAGLIFAILYWDDEHSYEAQNPVKNKAYFVVTDLSEDMVWGSSAAPVGKHISEVPEVSEYCYINSWYNSDIIKYKGRKEMAAKIIDAQANFFHFFPYHFIQGSADTALTPATIAISENLAKRLFGNENPMNRQVELTGKTFTVKGVYKIEGKGLYMPEVVTNMIDSKLKENENNWGSFSFGLFVMAKNANDGITIAQKIENLYYNYSTVKSAKKSAIPVDEYIKRYGKVRITTEQLATMRLHSKVNDIPEGRGSYQFLLIMAGLSILILVMSVANYVNLATANAVKRAKEVGVRQILGAGKRNIIYQFIFETVILTLFALLFALMIVEIALPYYNSFLGKKLVITNNRFFAELIIIFAVVVILAGVFPANYVAKFKAVEVLKGNFGRSKKGIWLRNSMLIAQFAIASFFIIGSYIVNQQVNYMAGKDLGFNGNQVVDIYFRNPYDFTEKGFRDMISARYNNIKERLMHIKGVQQVSAATFTMGNGSSFQSGFIYKNIEASFQNMAVDYNLTDILKLKIKEGRSLSPKYASDSINAVLLNETAIKLMGIKNPVGQYINYGNDLRMQIIGVVKDFHVSGPQDKILPMAFFHYKSINWMLQNAHSIYVKIDPQYTEEALAGMEKLWTEDVDPDYPFNYGFVDKNFERAYKSYVYQRNLFTLLNIVVIIIALLGLFALVSFSIQRRMKEIAIRRTLGAETPALLRELSKQYVIYCIAGFVIAFVPAWLLLDKWLENFAYRIQVGIVPFIAGFVAIMILTLAIVLGRAYNATKADVLKYLKYE
ncbi:FtsX-like permease family protein [Flavobacterium sp. Sd200]|uniref:ABC transporter permease n=1 Tax=Flavobacterium sp. Sd200 TaxID=2692211 RepID=UPI0013716A8E|nr:ABC transporter permease [Flavobacterium sp. Sd200]MXN90280.1 FtsX-like permease family protein [Flavobacterium sp. Sd200]